MLVNGVWQTKWNPYQEVGEQGEFVRQRSSFRDWIGAAGDTIPEGSRLLPAEAGRYHLYVALICPWACRTLMVRNLKGLQEVISVSVVEPFLTDQGWRFGDFPGSHQDTLNHARYVHELYTKADPTFTGRATVPVLWDKHNDTIVNNESADIISMLNSAFDAWGNSSVNLRPAALLDEIQSLNSMLYERLNNGVYRAGFAQSQSAYEAAFNDVFTCLDTMEARLAQSTYLLGEQLTEPDIRLFVTLVRFDAAYVGLFKCNRQQISDYPHLTRYMKQIYALPGIAETVNIEHIKQGYYSVKDLNPTGVVPAGPALDLLA